MSAVEGVSAGAAPYARNIFPSGISSSGTSREHCFSLLAARYSVYPVGSGSLGNYSGTRNFTGACPALVNSFSRVNPSSVVEPAGQATAAHFFQPHLGDRLLIFNAFATPRTTRSDCTRSDGQAAAIRASEVSCLCTTHIRTVTAHRWPRIARPGRYCTGITGYRFPMIPRSPLLLRPLLSKATVHTTRQSSMPHRIARFLRRARTPCRLPFRAQVNARHGRQPRKGLLALRGYATRETERTGKGWPWYWS